jgi:hypothetical protein
LAKRETRMCVHWSIRGAVGWQNIIRRLDPWPSLLMRKDGELLGEGGVLRQKVVPRPQSAAHERADEKKGGSSV